MRLDARSIDLPWFGRGAKTWYIWDPLENPFSGGGAGEVGSLGEMVASLMPYIFTIAGLILLFMIIASGYQLLTSTGNPEGMAKAKSRLTTALVGFIIVFAAFWIFQLIELFLGTTLAQ